ncbi:hypothetical protein Tco_0594946 [Tanacetum coccineum]
MSSIGELTFFLGLQVQQKEDGIFISQDKYVADILKKFDFVIVKTASTPIETNKALIKDEEAEDVDVHLYRSMIGSLMYLKASRPDIIYLKGQPKLGLWYPRDSPFDLEVFSDSDYAGASLDRKSTTRGCQFLGKRFISWQCKKQTIVAKSTTKAEYVAATNCCRHVLWIQNQMLDYGFNFMNTKIYIDNESTICIVKNPVFHSKTKHIEIRHHFIRDSYEKKLIQVINIHTDHNVADLLTKAFNVSRLDERECNIKQKWVKDETVYKEWEDIMERVATTASSLKAEQDSGSGPRVSITYSINLVAFLEKPKENVGFGEIIDFLNARSVQYALTINPTIYTTCIEQFWTSAKVKTVNGERKIQALVDKKKVIISETSIRSDLELDDAEGTNCLPTVTIFAELERMGYGNLTQKLTFYKAYFSSQWKFLIHTILQCLSAKTTTWNEFSSTMASAIICLATNQKFNFSKYIFNNTVKNLEGGVKFLMYPRFVQVFLDKQIKGMSKHKWIYVISSHTKKVFANMKREGKGFSGRVTPLFSTMMVQATKISRRKQRKDSAPTEPITEETTHEEHISTPSYDPPPSGEDRMQLAELMSLCTNLQEKVLDLEKANTAQSMKIASLKKRVKQLEKRRKSRTSGLRRLRKVGSFSRVESSNDASLGAQEDASKQGRKIEDLDADAEVTLVNDEEMLFDVHDDLVKKLLLKNATTIKETLAQTLLEIKAAKPNAVTTAATTITTVAASTRPKAKGIVFHEQEEQAAASRPVVSSVQPSSKDKGNAIMAEPEKPLKKKDQIALDEELAFKLHAEEQAELERMQRERDEQEEASRAAILEEMDSIQAMIEVDEQLAAKLQAEEQEKYSIE